MAPKQLKLVQGINFPPEFTAGLDEAGRGCLAGPVAAAAVILPAAFNLPGLDDSKKLSPAVRERLQTQIRQCAVAWSIGVVWPGRIAKVNILNATFEAMARAAAALKLLPRLLLVDGKHRIPAPVLLAWWPNGAPRPCQRAIVGGDSLEPAISAASIIAKTWRDRLMLALDRRWPGYGFARHKGYGTKEHLAALRALGPCPAHRLTFRGVLQSNSSPCLL